MWSWVGCILSCGARKFRPQFVGVMGVCDFVGVCFQIIIFFFSNFKGIACICYDVVLFSNFPKKNIL